MKIQEVIDYLEALAPLNYAEDFDNVGLLVGDKNKTVSGVLVTLDTLEAVVVEAIAKQCNLIVSFHPIIFKGLKSLTGKDYVERTVIKAIKHNIAIYAIHTALDNAHHGVNDIICNKLKLKNKRILIPQQSTIKKLTTYVPTKDAKILRTALFKAGAGNIGNYDSCSFNSEGMGTYRGNPDSNPKVGVRGEFHEASETQISVTFNKHAQSSILKALFKSHPYEEVAYEITSIENTNQHIGIGMVGELEQEQEVAAFFKDLKSRMQVPCIRHSEIITNTVKKIAVLGGSGSFAIAAAKAAGADMLITADLKYHDFYAAEGEIILADIGHYESEQFTKTFLVDYLSKKITNFAIVLSTTTTNPVKYL